MKKLVRNIVSFGAMLVAGSASANWFDCMAPVVGVDYYQANMRLKNNWDRFIPKSNYPGATGYIGIRFASCWGLELGYDGSATLSRNFHVRSDISGRTINGRAQTRRIGGHLDLMGYLPIDCNDCFELFGAVGYGYIKPKVNFELNRESDRNDLLQTIKGKGNSVARVGLGANYMMTDCVGLRAKVGYENTSGLKFTAPETEFVGTSLKPFKNSVTWAAGTFLKF